MYGIFRTPLDFVGGGNIALSDPEGDPPDGFSYLVNDNGNYLANSDNAWILAPDTPGPDSISDLALWLRASDLSLANNDPVSSWVSAEGNDFDFVQSTSGKKPTYKATSLINSLPAVSFDGGDILKCATVVSTANEGTLILILRRSGDSQYQTVFGQDIQAAGPYFAFYHRYDTARLGVDNIASAAKGPATTADSNDLVIISSDGATITIELNGTSGSVTDNTGGKWFADAASTNASIGGLAYSSDVQFFEGLIAEIIVYDHKLDGDELALIREYKLNTYGAA